MSRDLYVYLHPGEALEPLFMGVLHSEIIRGREVFFYFRLAPKKAESMLAAVRRSVSNWRAVADRYDIKKRQQDEMEPAFRY
jgi:hypothetical protein